MKCLDQLGLHGFRGFFVLFFSKQTADFLSYSFSASVSFIFNSVILEILPVQQNLQLRAAESLGIWETLTALDQV